MMVTCALRQSDQTSDACVLVTCQYLITFASTIWTWGKLIAETEEYGLPDLEIRHPQSYNPTKLKDQHPSQRARH